MCQFQGASDIIIDGGKLICRKCLEVGEVSGNIVINLSEIVFVVGVKEEEKFRMET